MTERADLSGMTVTERLAFCGLFDGFDRPRGHWDVEALRLIFAEIGLEGYDIEQLR
ncbi:hypothetical protein [Novosphingobium sp. AAP93]|uniref:hypothetical protein n=1 Tax=Novosphingobium sp. AAP93 TaxID=1523427 RepID=UPI000B222A23|nr:hypothetical protein [Novosphingobium sp. AAP93]